MNQESLDWYVEFLQRRQEQEPYTIVYRKDERGHLTVVVDYLGGTVQWE